MENYAVALSILDEKLVTNDAHILIGIRKPESNSQHSNVVSVPTERIPEPLFKAIESEASLDAPWSDANKRPGSSPSTYVVKSIFSQKLGLADALELGNLQFVAAPRSTFLGVTPIISDNDEPTQWNMAQIAVHFLSLNASDLPSETASYRHISWMRVGDFLEKVENGFFLDKSQTVHNEYIVGGLCVQNTARWLKEAMNFGD